MQKHLPKHLSKKSIALQSLLVKKRENDWKNKPTSWPNIRKNAQDGHIYLLVDTRYPIGFVATATDGYSVAIDGAHYGDYVSNTQFAMADWADYTDTEGYDISEPTGTTKAHIIDIYPQTESEKITAFHCTRVATSGLENQGVLWAHFNITNEISLLNGFATNNQVTNSVLFSITSKNNILNVTNIFAMCMMCYRLQYVPILVGDNITRNIDSVFNQAGNYTSIDKVVIKNFKTGTASYACYASKVKEFHLVNCDTSSTTDFQRFFDVDTALEKFSGFDFSSAKNMTSFLFRNKNLKDMVLDVSSAKQLTKIGCFADVPLHFMEGFKGLRVSNEAPFNNATPPQISVSYTGMDRTALVQLFNDLPIVSAGQIINIVSCTGTSDLTADDEAIATAKGWTITK